MKARSWAVLGWALSAGLIAWGVLAGSWMLNATQEATDLWVGRPHAIPFVPYMATDFLLGPLAPFHALLARGDWLPLTSMVVCGGGIVAFWYAAKSSLRQASIERS